MVQILVHSLRGLSSLRRSFRRRRIAAVTDGKPGLPGRRAQGGSLEASNRDTRYFRRGLAAKREACLAFRAAANVSSASRNGAGIGSCGGRLRRGGFTLLDSNGERNGTVTAPFWRMRQYQARPDNRSCGFLAPNFMPQSCYFRRERFGAKFS